MKTHSIPSKAIYRLSVYARCLRNLHDDGVRTISSQTLAKAAGVKSTQLRKDLNYFGRFGTRGRGYDVQCLISAIAEVLGKNLFQPVVLVGVGHLGSALMAYSGFQREGFEILAGFDIEARNCQYRQFHQPVLPMSELESFCRQHRVKMAILTVPGPVAQDAAQQLVKAGVTAILNFAPAVLHLPKKIKVNSANLAMELEHLSYYAR